MPSFPFENNQQSINPLITDQDTSAEYAIKQNDSGSSIFLILASALILLFMLGTPEIWTQEIRWAEICRTMMTSGDYLHPYLYGYPYYDKPLLSYWFMIGTSFLLGHLSEWSLRLPSALAGIVATGCTYWLGKHLVNKRVGLIAGWMLITTYYFIFWARTANSDMLNVAGILLALTWYFKHKEHPGFYNYCVFFCIIAIASLCKGLLAAVIPVLVIIPDLLMNKEWQKHLRPSLLLAAIPALIIYFLPFWASTHFGGQQYGESGLVEVFRENILRFVHPFDHQGPIYTYFIYLPIYILPWAVFFIPAIFTLKNDWPKMANGERWLAWALLLVFVFFTASGSRRNYYTLPMVPFAILYTASWIGRHIDDKPQLKQWTRYFVFGFYGLLFSLFGIIKPYHYSSGGLRPFATQVQRQATAIQPWSQWTVAILNPEDQAPYYVNPAKVTYHPLPNRNIYYPTDQLLQYWPVVKAHPANTIFLTSLFYARQISPYLQNYIEVIAPPHPDAKWWHRSDNPTPVAFIPRQDS